MRVVHWGRARQFFRLHKNAEVPLKQWKTAVLKAKWKNFPDVRAEFSSADWVDGKIVFDIKGNHYRLIAITQFANGRLYICDVLTHEDYDRGDWKK